MGRAMETGLRAAVALIVVLAASVDAALRPVKLKNWGYTQFVGQLSIGTPQQTFRVIYDTGSSNTWLPGHQCEEASCDKYGKYNHRKSSSFSKMYTQEGLGESRRSK